MKPEPMQHANALPNKQSPLVMWLDQYGNAATIVACVAMIGGAIWYSYNRTSTGRNERAWARYSQARTTQDFGDIADDFANTDVGAWARLGEGERLAESGIGLMFTDRKAGLGELKNADEAFNKVLAMKSAASAARERAAWGLAKSTEAQCDGDTTKANDAYQALLKQFPKSLYKAAAEERIESLKSESAKEFYVWFHKQNPKPPEASKPKDGLPDGHPPFDLPLDDTPDDDQSKTKKPNAKDDDKSEESKPDDKKDAKKPDPKDSPDDKPNDGDKPTTEPKSSAIERLKMPASVSFQRTPLQDAFAFIGDYLKVEIAIDGDALKAAGFTKNMPQTLTMEDATGLEVIGAILKKYEKEKRPLVLVIQGEKALITTTEFASKNNQIPFEFSKPAEPPKTDEPKTDEPKTDEPKDDKPKSESKDKDAPAESK